jgi:two-component sensor histidine kinase
MQLISDINCKNSLNNLNCGFFICDNSGNFLNCNEIFSQKLGYLNKEDFFLKQINEIYVNDTKELFLTNINTKDNIADYDLRFFNKDRLEITLTINSFKSIDNLGNEWIINYCMDKFTIQEQLNQIKNNEKSLNTILNSNYCGILLFEFNDDLKEYEITYNNDIAKVYLSKNLDKIYLNKIFEFIEVEKINEINITGSLTYDWELYINNTNIIRYLTLNFSLINNGESKPLISVNIIDKTKEFLKLNEIENQLEHTIQLISEINHRVNNNLSIIDGIIEIKKIKLKDEYALEKLSDIQLKIKSIALVYQKTNQSVTINSINVNKYITEITNYFKNTFYNEGFKTLKFKININSEISLASMKAVQFGLLLSELMFNSYKYGNETSDINIEINIETDESIFMMKYLDSGNGLPIDVMDLKSGSFGFKLIESLIKQLNATYKLPVSKNFEFNLEFKN